MFVPYTPPYYLRKKKMVAKRKTKTTKWVAKKRKGRIEAEIILKEPEVAQEAGDTTFALKESAPVAQHWFSSVSSPGLHIMRSQRGQEYQYDVVRVLFTDNGYRQCYEPRWANGNGLVDLSSFNSCEFQKVGE